MASVLKVNTLTGVTTAGSIDVTGEGNSTTTNLQQGLAKSWVNHTDAAAITDSLNVASGTDNSTGNYDLTFTNPMANATYSPSVCTLFAQLASIGQEAGDRATTFYQVQCFTRQDSLGAVDSRAFSQIFGDLA
tara:strand:+ start:339 stop:737 length:399 start_codon:yes stop_codon:yes gene_type:complete